MAKTNNEKREYYNEVKDFNGQKYTGMQVGGSHSWRYDKGIWKETKITPDKWKFEFDCLKSRMHQAPSETGALDKTEYHWYIIADQKVVKMDENTYNTIMKGAKFKIGHKRPNWNNWNYQYHHESYEDKIIKILEEVIAQLKAKKRGKELTSYF
jgi:hypothetical protein